MTYADVYPAAFIDRPNRFIARVAMQGQTLVCHVKNTGRLGELLLPGAPVWVQRTANPNRKTGWDLVAVDKAGTVVNIDSGAPNKVFAEWLAAGVSAFGPVQGQRAEVRYGASRIDFAFTAAGRPWYAEVKGVTLERDGLALFPDAPTQRGVRHLGELAAAARAGYGAAAVFIVQLRGPAAFAPNAATHPEFADALRAAAAAGVRVLALDCAVTPDTIAVRGELPVRL